ncbi:MAG: phage integrase SAM-like domain-containing protein [Algoriphagus sp.]|nr:phage integrase SAM-like domain-containing protein [Algoriphagus sp.]
MALLYVSVEIDPQYNRKTNPNKRGEYAIYLVLRKVRLRAYIIPDLPKIPLDHFQNVRGNWVNKANPHARKINLKISQVFNILENYIVDHGPRLLKPLDVKEWYLKNHTKGGEFKDFRSERVLDYFEKNPKTGISKSSRIQYECALKRLEEFKPDCRFYHFDRKFVEDFAYFLGNHEKLKGSTGGIYLDKIKAIFIKWYAENHKEDPVGYDRLFKRVMVKKGKVKENRGFTQSELQKFIALNLGHDPRLELVRDLVVFMCFSSRYLKELMALSFEDVRIDSNDPSKILIIGSRSKTGVDFKNQIFPGIQMEIFEKYHPSKSGKLFPQVTETFGPEPHQKFIYTLKKLTDQIGMGEDFNPGVKLGRVTFQTLISRDLDRFTKKVMLGHTNTQTQERYNSAFFDLFELTKGRIPSF